MKDIGGLIIILAKIIYVIILVTAMVFWIIRLFLYSDLSWEENPFEFLVISGFINIFLLASLNLDKAIEKFISNEKET